MYNPCFWFHQRLANYSLLFLPATPKLCNTQVVKSDGEGRGRGVRRGLNTQVLVSKDFCHIPIYSKCPHNIGVGIDLWNNNGSHSQANGMCSIPTVFTRTCGLDCI
jgi:hypothetical protein